MKAGIPWYPREQWSRWIEISVDRAEICSSYGEWLKRAEESIKDFTRAGIEVRKVDVDVEEFLAWAEREKTSITGHARADFANLKFGNEHVKRPTALDRPPPSSEEIKRMKQEAKGMDLSEVWAPYLRRPKAAICPIFRETSAGPEQMGSGVLLKVGHAHFLLTAAHVTDERGSNILLVPAQNGFVNLRGLFLQARLPSSGFRDDETRLIWLLLDYLTIWLVASTAIYCF